MCYITIYIIVKCYVLNEPSLRQRVEPNSSRRSRLRGRTGVCSQVRGNCHPKNLGSGENLLGLPAFKCRSIEVSPAWAKFRKVHKWIHLVMWVPSSVGVEQGSDEFVPIVYTRQQQCCFREAPPLNIVVQGSQLVGGGRFDENVRRHLDQGYSQQ